MGRIVDGLKKAIKNATGVEVAGKTKGEVLADYNLKATEIALTLSIVDGDGAEISTPTVTLKTGKTVGSGTSVSAGGDGKYAVKLGGYNYSIAKVGYTGKTGTIDITAEDVAAGEKTVVIALAAST